jgi:hypothetical protein
MRKSGIKINRYRWCLAVSILVGAAMTLQAKWLTVHNDFEEYDLDGKVIQTRSGCLCRFGDTYYWYGCDFQTMSNQTCYSSKDLLHWTNKGVLLKASSGTNRMDVMYNDSTKQYVMIMKYGSYAFGVATCSTPDGQFSFKGSSSVFGYNIGDCSVYKDFDGKCYFLYLWDSIPGANSGGISQHAIAAMSSDYTKLTKRLWLWNRGSREAMMMMKHNGIYYYLTSLTAYIDPTLTEYYTAPSPAGPWTDNLVPIIAPGDVNNVSWDTQCDYVFVFKGPNDTAYMYCGDRWKKPRPTRLGDYVWTPITFTPHDSVMVNYYQDWEVEADLGLWRPIDSTRNLALHKTATASSTSGSNAPINVTDYSTWENYTNTKWTSESSDPQWIMVDLGSEMSINRVILKWDSAYAKAFKIQVSKDTATWTDVFSTTKAGLRSITDETFAVTAARYVRMYGTQRGNTSKGYSLFEFMVLNDAGATATTFRHGKSPVASEALLVCKNNTIHYRVPSENSVKLDIVDGRGKRVAMLVDGFKHAGDHDAVLPCTIGHGMYLIRLTAGAKKLASLQVRL